MKICRDMAGLSATKWRSFKENDISIRFLTDQH